MYCEEKIAERLKLARAQLGWMPVYHSIDEVEDINTRLREIAIFNDAGKFQDWTRPLTDQEKWWIRNERTLCACDASYFLTRYSYVKDEKNNIFRFAFRFPQKVYFNVIAELERRGSAIQLQILKARQLGMSTLTELLVLHRILFYYGTNAIVASSAIQQTQIMTNMIFLAYDRLPHWLAPTSTRRSEGEKGQLAFGSISSGVSFQHGSQTTGIARGHTPTVVHLSEVAAFANANELIEESLFRAVHESPNVFMVLESTAEGVDNWWHKTWKISKSKWGKGGKLYPMFLPWYIGTDMYPTATWIKDRPVQPDFRPIQETREMMAKAKMFVASSGILADVLGKDWQMGREQAWFWQTNFEEARAKGREKSLMQELPGTDIEAFQSSYDSVFGNEAIETLHSQRKMDYKVYAMRGHGIEDHQVPPSEDFDFEGMSAGLVDVKKISYQANSGKTYSWEFIPMRRDLIDDSDPENLDQAVDAADGKLLVFRGPEDGYDYTIGVDTGYGKGADSTCISVWRKGVRGMPDVQCAEFAGAFIHHVEAYAFVMPIAAYYAKFMRNDTPREPLVSIEVLEAVGDPCQLNMRKMGYGRFHHFVRYDTKKIQKKSASKLGWYTTGWSRPMLIGGFVNSVQNEWVHIHSPLLLREMSKFEVHSTARRQRMEHAEGAHDDRIFAAAIAIFTSHDLEPMVERGKNRPMPPRGGSDGAGGAGGVGSGYRPPLDLTPIGGYRMPTRSDSISALEVPARTTRDLEDYIASERLMR